jgi:hypothetical protein
VIQRLCLVGITAMAFLLSIHAAAQPLEPTKKVTIAVSGMT